MDREQKRAHARTLIADPVFQEILDELEAEWIDAAVHGKQDEKLINLDRVRAVRDLKGKLKALCNEDKRQGRQGVA